jgi:FtsH-binding integral membrane protein
MGRLPSNFLAATFGAMNLCSYTTRRDLTAFRLGLIGIFIAPNQYAHVGNEILTI